MIYRVLVGSKVKKGHRASNWTEITSVCLNWSQPLRALWYDPEPAAQTFTLTVPSLGVAFLQGLRTIPQDVEFGNRLVKRVEKADPNGGINSILCECNWGQLAQTKNQTEHWRTVTISYMSLHFPTYSITKVNHFPHNPSIGRRTPETKVSI